MKHLILLICSLTISQIIIAQNNPITFDPVGTAGGDLFGIKVTENGNNTSKFSIYRNFSFENQDVDALVIDSSRRIGINTSTPNSRLDIKGFGNETELLRLSTERP